jgi:hypothetical protein
VVVIDGGLGRGRGGSGFRLGVMAREGDRRPRPTFQADPNAAVICLARRRCDVIHAMLRNGTLYDEKSSAGRLTKSFIGHPRRMPIVRAIATTNGRCRGRKFHAIGRAHLSYFFIGPLRFHDCRREAECGGTYRVSTSSNTKNVCVSRTPGIDCS